MLIAPKVLKQNEMIQSKGVPHPQFSVRYQNEIQMKKNKSKIAELHSTNWRCYSYRCQITNEWCAKRKSYMNEAVNLISPEVKHTAEFRGNASYE